VKGVCAAEKVESAAAEKVESAAEKVESAAAEKVESAAAGAGLALGSAVGSYLGNAKIETCRVQLEMVGMNLEMYYARNDAYPKSLRALLAKERSVKPSSLVDPWEQPLTYRLGDDTFKLCSKGPDGVAGTDDDICLPWVDEEMEVAGRDDSPPPCAVTRLTLSCGKAGCAMELPFLEKIDELHVVLSSGPRVKSVASIGYLLRRLHFVMGDSKPEFDVVPARREARLQFLLLLEMGSEENLLSHLMNLERSQVTLQLELASSAADAREWLESEVAHFVGASSLAGSVQVKVNQAVECQSARETLGELVRLGESVRVEEGSLVFGGAK